MITKSSRFHGGEWPNLQGASSTMKFPEGQVSWFRYVIFLGFVMEYIENNIIIPIVPSYIRHFRLGIHKIYLLVRPTYQLCLIA